MSLFGSLYVGNSGLTTSQNALNTVAHNMVNVDTQGYTRQQVSLATKFYNTISKSGSAVSYQQVGLGVSFTEVRQIRDYFLDKSYRKESGRSGFYDMSCDAIEEIEKIFQELDGKSFAATLNNLWESVQELSKDPSNTVNQGIFIQRCSEFVTRSQAVYQDLSDYQDDLNFQVKQKVDKINSIGKEIRSLNEEILKIESAQVEHANDLRDQRNKLIDELSEYASLNINTDIDGNYIIQIEGVDFVTVGDSKEIGLYQDPVNGFYTPYWVQLAPKDPITGMVSETTIKGAEVFDLNMPISTELNTDIGALKSALVARGDRRTTYEDLDPSKYDSIKDSVVMNIMAEFDQLVHDITTGINDTIVSAAKDYYGGTLPTSGYLIDSATGEPYKIFDVASNENSINHAADPEAWKYDYVTPNIMINAKLKQSPSLLGFIRPDGIVDQGCADNLKKLFTEEEHTLNPEVKTKTSLRDYYNNLISQVANTGSVMRGISANQEITVTNISASREQILGVSSDEELSNMIMFQNAFNASSRYINTVSEMMEHLINSL
ncbi:MAG: flagellar hook-associated protein FlgK [Lachnospiraceae bacterium]|nr:flagellar hook-associated protein FlgK [Lachnospiraceae bacterium]